MSPTSSNAQMKKPMIPRIMAPTFTGTQQQHVLILVDLKWWINFFWKLIIFYTIKREKLIYALFSLVKQ